MSDRERLTAIWALRAGFCGVEQGRRASLSANALVSLERAGALPGRRKALLADLITEAVAAHGGAAAALAALLEGGDPFTIPSFDATTPNERVRPPPPTLRDEDDEATRALTPVLRDDDTGPTAAVQPVQGFADEDDEPTRAVTFKRK